MPASLHACTNRTAPLTLSWSVSARAGISSAAARCTSSSMEAAPSRKEKGECTCKWTKPAALVIDAVQPPFAVGGVKIQLEQAAVGRFHFDEEPFAFIDPPAAHVAPPVDDAGHLVRAAPPLKRCRPRLGRFGRRRRHGSFRPPARLGAFGPNDAHRRIDKTHQTTPRRPISGGTHAPPRSGYAAQAPAVMRKSDTWPRSGPAPLCRGPSRPCSVPPRPCTP